MKFARFMGMESIPAKTVEKFRTDPYFRYCFYRLKLHHTIYDMNNWPGNVARERLKTLLNNSELFTNEDLFHGLTQYLNNFIHYLPKGYKRGLLEIPEAATRVRPIIAAVDQVLEEMGATEQAVTLRAELDGNASNPKGTEYLKLCLKVFNILVERDGFDAKMLWT